MYSFNGKKYNNIWFTSDERYKKSSFDDGCYDMIQLNNNILINNHNTVVSPNDLIFHLGNFGDYKYLEYLNGNHILLTDYSIDSNIKYNFISTNCLLFIDDNIKNLFSNRLSKHIHAIHCVQHDWEIKQDSLGKPIFIKELNKYIVNLFGNKCNTVAGYNVSVDNNNFYPVSTRTIEYHLIKMINNLN